MKKMKTKICALCKVEETTLFRVQIQKGKIWIFVCEACCKKAQSLPDYKYGGTWKGYRH
jgi:protein-arginine kinase activator protein McsA